MGGWGNGPLERGPRHPPRQGSTLPRRVVRVVRSEIVARATLRAEPFKYVTLPDPEIALKRYGDPQTVTARGLIAQPPQARSLWSS